jgi:hypothetical protein
MASEAQRSEYAEIAMMSSSDSFATTFFISAAFVPRWFRSASE